LKSQFPVASASLLTKVCNDPVGFQSLSMNVAQSPSACHNPHGCKSSNHSECESNFRSLYNTSSSCYLTVDTEGKVCEWSWPLAMLLGFTEEEIIGFVFIELVSIEYYGTVLHSIDKVQQLHHCLTTAARLVVKDGTLLDVTLQILACAQGEQVLVVTQPFLVSTQGLWVELGFAAFEVSSNGNITAWNARMSELSDYTTKDVMGLSIFHLWPYRWRDKVHRMLRLSTEKSGPSTCQIDLYAKTGIVKLVRMHALALRNQAGKVIRIAIVVEDLVKDEHSSQHSNTDLLPTPLDMLLSGSSGESLG